MTGRTSVKWIAERKLVDGDGGKMKAMLGIPEKVSAHEWRCPFRVSRQGERSSEPRYAHGIDAIQALIQALAGIRAALAAQGTSATWEGGEPGDSGFPAFVPSHFGLDFSKKLEGLITGEVERFAAAARKR